MRRLGSILLVVGAIVGCVAGIWVTAGIERVALPWLVSIGLVKLIVAASFGIMGVGAALIRLARKSELRERTAVE